jgi:hypothetical protein
MPCEYCVTGKTLLDKEVVNHNTLAFGGPVEPKDLWRFEYNLGVFIDRGYLRMVDIGDCNCLDGGEKIQIKYCPMCGEEVEQL